MRFGVTFGASRPNFQHSSKDWSIGVSIKIDSNWGSYKVEGELTIQRFRDDILMPQ